MMPPIVYVLLVAHFVADFLAQSDWMALNKSKSWHALIAHVVTYTAVLQGVLMIWVVGLWWPRLEAALIVPYMWRFFFANMVAHFVQDAIASRITARLFPWQLIRLIDLPAGSSIGDFAGRGWMVPKDGGNRHWFFVAIGFDQLLHYVTLFVTASWWLR